jgi:hypothetical protein
MPQVPTIEEVKQYLVEGMSSSELDETEFMEGARMAYVTMHEDLFMTEQERRLARARHDGGRQ